MFRLWFVILACSFCFEISVSSAKEPVIISFNLTTFGGDIERIKSLHNTSWPLVGKCCPVGQLYRFNDDDNPGENRCEDPRPNEKNEYSPFFSDFNHSGLLVPGLNQPQFVAVIGIPCRYGKYIMDPLTIAEDEYHLMMNGSVFTPLNNVRMLQPGQDYCMEVVSDGRLVVMGCYQPELKVVTADTRLAMYAIGLLISVPFLLATIISYVITRQICDVHGMNLCCYSGCLAVAFLTLALLQLGGQSFDQNACVSAAFVIQFSFIASSFWLNAMTVESWRLIRGYKAGSPPLTSERSPPLYRVFFFYSIWGWGLSAVLIVVSLALGLNPTIPWTYVKRSGNEQPSCWFGYTYSLPYFYVPVGILVFLNTTLFVMAGIKMAQIQRALDRNRVARNNESDRRDRRVFKELRLTFFFTLALFLILVVNWSMELVSMLTESNVFAWSIFDLVNALQGLFVFGFFVLRRAVRTLVWQRIKELVGIGSERESDDDKANEMTLLSSVTNGTNSTRIVTQ
ncbi:G-protein coupled receptor Mth2-like isoform X2 [Neodiprion fabricii]|uniref:G-protein coupled receptor Mth2-like isoform X2 n=1 Tax=Neodiprion fabricii TaxID=2872261 RepID=UPI001ED9063E|nr:G-protein coupled receptor Mth2-like isoform X2 [Neodiprion fabricii]